MDLKLIDAIERCRLPKLNRNVDECDSHAEYELRKSSLDQHFPLVLKLLEQENLNEGLLSSPSVISSLLILYKELQIEGPWGAYKEYSSKLNSHFQVLCEANLDTILKNDAYNTQELFDECLQTLNQMLPLEVKKYPILIEVYCLLITDLKEYRVAVNPLKTLPISLVLTEDYETTYKVKGLKSCRAILECLMPKDFDNGNYYEVVYGSLKKTFVTKDIDVIYLVIECFVELLRILPINSKTTIVDDLYTNVLEQLNTESNLYKKAALFGFTTKLIEIHGVKCINRKTFKIIVTDNLDVCCNNAVGKILLKPLLKCLEVWITHCWCNWNLYTDKQLLSNLFKILYARRDEVMAERIMNLIQTLISISTEAERKQIANSLNKAIPIKCVQYQKWINKIKKTTSA